MKFERKGMFDRRSDGRRQFDLKVSKMRFFDSLAMKGIIKQLD